MRTIIHLLTIEISLLQLADMGLNIENTSFACADKAIQQFRKIRSTTLTFNIASYALLCVLELVKPICKASSTMLQMKRLDTWRAEATSAVRTKLLVQRVS